MSDERDDFDNLLKSPGWLRLKMYAEEQWTGRLTQYLAQATGDRDDAIALQRLRQVIAAKEAVERLLAWPSERLRVLTPVAPAALNDPTVFARRGPL